MNSKKIDKIIFNLKNRKKVLDEILSRYNIGAGDEPVIFETECNSLKKLKVAAIMDEFTLGNFRSECDLLEVTADNWKAQLAEFKPDLFFLESAWSGKDNSWYRKIANGSKEIYDLTDYCHEKDIPVIFWNKEDPVYTDTFMAAASCADFVFTTDFDCIEKYKRTLQHKNVYLLHFSAQPLVHNPLEIHDRKDKFCFAGAYYHRYKDRSRVFDEFTDIFEKGKGLEIFDRNLGNARPEHAFPQRYNKMIVGTLSPDDIHIAYKGYNYGINMNSVSQSQTMFARRVYELLASNTVSVGNYSRGVKNLFGDLTVATDSAVTMQKHLEKYCSTDEDYRKYRLLGLRSVLKEHLCEDRLGFVAKCVFGKDMREKLPLITVVASVADENEKARVTKAFEKQSYENKKLVFVNCEDYIEEDGFVAAFSADDYYGENYLLDLALSVRYSSADGFGKNHYYSKNENGIELNGTEGTYKPCNNLFSTRCIVKASSVEDIKAFASGTEIEGEFICVDEFNYCRNCADDKCANADDIFVADKGISLEKINAASASMNFLDFDSEILSLSASDLAADYKSKVKNVDVKYEAGKLVITSELDDESFAYLYFSTRYPVRDFCNEDTISAMFSGSGNLSSENFCLFYDENKQKVGAASSIGNRLLTSQIPENAVYVSFCLRVRGRGRKELFSITASGNFNSQGATPFLSRSDTIVVADRYPSYEDLYRYMFVHKRIALYKDEDLVSDMMCINMWGDNTYREFEGINITEGGAERLAKALDGGTIKNVCVHFLNPYMWSVLKNYLEDIKLTVWVHGSDIQPWHRRSFNYSLPDEIETAKKDTAQRMEFWNEVIESAKNYDIHFVCVSEHFRSTVEEDYNTDLKNISSVIHNCIDTDMFSYEKKDPGQRFNIMSVKSFSTLTYANDVTRKAIIYLSNEPEFSKMTFDLYGDGDRFEEDTKNLKKFPNVHLHRGFLTQSQIAQLHKTHGIYIATTRMDTQGVSRDEAMSSGLVPVANAVAAIPEFVDETCGILAPAEDAQAVAQGILKLVRDPELFAELSENAAKRVRSKTAKEYTISKEVALIKSRRDEK